MARNKEANQKIKDERREQILTNALILFAGKGLTATRIADISEVSGISQGLIYHYFKSKEEIYVELIRTAYERMSNACLDLERLSLPPGEKVKKAIEELLQGFETNQNTSYYYLLNLQAAVSEAIPAEAKEIITAHSTIPYEVMERIMAQGQAEGSLKDCYTARDMAAVFWTAIKGLALTRASFGGRFQTPDPQILIDVFVRESRV